MGTAEKIRGCTATRCSEAGIFQSAARQETATSKASLQLSEFYLLIA